MKVKTRSQIPNSRRSTEQWQDIMSAYEQSGLTQDAFCSRESIAPSTFYNWRKRLSGENSEKQKKSAFVELVAPSLPSILNEWDMELTLGEHVVLRLRQPN